MCYEKLMPGCLGEGWNGWVIIVKGSRLVISFCLNNHTALVADSEKLCLMNYKEGNRDWMWVKVMLWGVQGVWLTDCGSNEWDTNGEKFEEDNCFYYLGSQVIEGAARMWTGCGSENEWRI